MNFSFLLHTVKHLKPTQVWFQVRYRLFKPKYKAYDTSGFRILNSLQSKAVKLSTGFKTEPIAKYPCLKVNVFSFLNLEHQFAGWDFKENGMLWAYNQNYFDWINQDAFSEEEGCKWIDKFIAELPQNRVGLDPYPIALRSINWVKFFCRHPECATKLRLDSLYSQTKLLEKKLEYHLLANHLLEDAYALFITSVFLGDERLYIKASRLLQSQLKEQVLADGAHFEQSPMYHCILLDRLLDCINIAKGFSFQTLGSKIISNHLTPDIILLSSYAERMLGHLESIAWQDGTIPFLNDSAYGIAPIAAQIFDYAQRLGLEWNAIPIKESGYRKLVGKEIEAVVDVGNITATYQPGHTHADTLNYELRIAGKPIVVDCGISTYEKTARRQYERGTAAHNCVVVGGKNSSEVWGGFRVGNRCVVVITEETDSEIEARHNGFGAPCKRRFLLEEDGFTVEDRYDGEAVSYVHLADNVDESRVSISGADKVEVLPWRYSTEYNRFKEGKEIKISFRNNVKYTIR